MPAHHKEEDILDKAKDKIEVLQHKAEEYKNTLVAYVEKNPISALALAAAAGILIGTCWSALRAKK